jgi:hypothetical protein
MDHLAVHCVDRVPARRGVWLGNEIAHLGERAGVNASDCQPISRPFQGAGHRVKGDRKTGTAFKGLQNRSLKRWIASLGESLRSVKLLRFHHVLPKAERFINFTILIT